MRQERDAAERALPQPPQEWVALFEKRLNAGDLDGVLELYEQDARFVSPSGETVTGRERMRPVLADLMRRGTRLHGRVVRVVLAGEIALLYTDWTEATASERSASLASRQRALEIVRRQPDGSWRLLVGDPQGRSRAEAARG